MGIKSLLSAEVILICLLVGATFLWPDLVPKQIEPQTDVEKKLDEMWQNREKFISMQKALLEHFSEVASQPSSQEFLSSFILDENSLLVFVKSVLSNFLQQNDLKNAELEKQIRNWVATNIPLYLAQERMAAFIHLKSPQKVVENAIQEWIQKKTELERKASELIETIDQEEVKRLQRETVDQLFSKMYSDFESMKINELKGVIERKTRIRTEIIDSINKFDWDVSGLIKHQVQEITANKAAAELLSEDDFRKFQGEVHLEEKNEFQGFQNDLDTLKTSVLDTLATQPNGVKNSMESFRQTLASINTEITKLLEQYAKQVAYQERSTMQELIKVISRESAQQVFKSLATIPVAQIQEKIFEAIEKAEANNT